MSEKISLDSSDKDYENYKFIQGSRIRSNDYRKRYEYRSESSGKQLHHQ